MRWKLYVGPFAVLALACLMGLVSAGVALWGLERGNQPHYFQVPVQFLPPAEGTIIIPPEWQPKPPSKPKPKPL